MTNLFPSYFHCMQFDGSNMKVITNQQRLHWVNTEQLYENYLAAYRQPLEYYLKTS